MPGTGVGPGVRAIRARDAAPEVSVGVQASVRALVKFKPDKLVKTSGEPGSRCVSKGKTVGQRLLLGIRGIPAHYRCGCVCLYVCSLYQQMEWGSYVPQVPDTGETGF